MQSIIDILFPPRCVACKKRLPKESRFKSICDTCFESIEIENSFKCPKCFNRLPLLNEVCHPEMKFILASATTFQNNAARELIYSLKYKHIKESAIPLAKIAEIYIKKSGLIELIKESAIVIPVPLYKTKEKKRGFNQSNTILEKLRAGDSFSLEVVTGVLIRTKSTTSQTECVDYEGRIKNVAGVFRVNKSEIIRNKNIIIFDDVYTSGATMKEAVKVLKKAGARKIISLVITKA